jgi:hypothetical protein
MITRRRALLWLVLVFVLGIAADIGLGYAYGVNLHNAQLERQYAELDARFRTVNENYVTLVREYNKLFSLRAWSVEAGAGDDAIPPVVQKPPATSAPAVQATVEPQAQPTAQAPVEATAETAAPTEPPAAEATPSPESGGATALKADFSALAVDGSGEHEGPPPQLVKFTDLSTGEITSWEWDFGDGAKSSEQNPEHTYMGCPGERELCTVRLTVCGPSGCVTETKLDLLWISVSCEGC